MQEWSVWDSRWLKYRYFPSDAALSFRKRQLPELPQSKVIKFLLLHNIVQQTVFLQIVSSISPSYFRKYLLFWSCPSVTEMGRKINAWMNEKLLTLSRGTRNDTQIKIQDLIRFKFHLNCMTLLLFVLYRVPSKNLVDGAPFRGGRVPIICALCRTSKINSSDLTLTLNPIRKGRRGNPSLSESNENRPESN